MFSVDPRLGVAGASVVGSLKGLNSSDLRSNPGKNGNPTRHETTSFQVSLISHDITILYHPMAETKHARIAADGLGIALK